MKTLFVSFSGGKTSGFMSRWIQLNWADRYDKIYYLFANTGQEHEKTLEFVQACNDAWGLDVVWLEAVVDPRKGYGIRHRVVDFETASRDGQPFEDQIAKEGIPNPANRKCSDRLKLNPMISYRKSLGHKTGSYDTAVGIRCDEIDRINPNYIKNRIKYPLVFDYPTNVSQVHRFWESLPFSLEIKSNYGNCLTCWAKSDRKLMTNYQDHPEWFEFFDRMEKQYGDIKSTGVKFENGERRVFFRNHKSVQDLIAMAKQPFTRFEDHQDGAYTPDMFMDDLDVSGICGDSCDPFYGDKTI